ncbi:DNA adenine methylase [Microseira wollei]|nr:DNA adenine methylase [Microseira wollei]
MATLPHPIQYQGSKRNLASDILRFLPNRVERLVEPFAGTAAISIAASSRLISQIFWINDLNKPLIELLKLIVQYGFITTEELKQRYGYNHPPRAARDVREHGIPLETFRVTGTDGRRIAAYKFADISKARFTRLSGRTGLSKQLKNELIRRFGCKCFIYLEEVDERELQIDHRVPFEVDGEPELEPEHFMLLCGSAKLILYIGVVLTHMQITINLPQDLEQYLIQQATQLNIPLETFILQSLRQITQLPLSKTSQWSSEILSYTGIPDFPAFESYRDELLPPRELELF